MSGFSNDSCSITWHQWQVEDPIERKIGLFSSRALAKPTSPQENQSTGLWACWSRYGDFSRMSRLGFSSPDIAKQTTFRVYRLGLIHKSEWLADLQALFEWLRVSDGKPPSA